MLPRAHNVRPYILYTTLQGSPHKGAYTQRKYCNILQLYLLWAGLSTRFFMQTVSK